MLTATLIYILLVTLFLLVLGYLLLSLIVVLYLLVVLVPRPRPRRVGIEELTQVQHQLHHNPMHLGVII